MRKQSATYSPFSETRTLDFEVSFGLINEAAKNRAVVSASGSAFRTDASQTIDRQYKGLKNWATFERNGWILGGGNKILSADDSAEQFGWWSDIDADSTGKFSAQGSADPTTAILGVAKLGIMILGNASTTSAGIPYISFEFGEPVTTYGWSLYFDEKNGIYPTQIRITAFADNGKTVVYEMNYENDEDKAYISAVAENYTSLKIEFLAMNQPYRKVRVLEIDFGITQIFDKDTLVRASIAEGVDIAARTLPSRQLTFVFDNSKKIYNMLNPTMLYDYFSKGSEIFAKIIVNGEAVDLGKFYFTNATTKSNSLTAEITANDIILQLGDVMYSRTEGVEMTLGEAVDEILTGVSVERIYEKNVDKTKVFLSAVSSTSKREMLRMLAQAAMCTCYVNRDGQMIFKRVDTANTYVSTIDKDALYDYNGISVSDPVDKVVLTVNDPTIYGGIRTFEAGSGSNVVEVMNACVHDDNGEAVAAWLLECYQRRVHYKVKNRCDPAVEMSDTIKLDDTYGENLNASVTGVNIKYSGGIYATTEAVR